mgnify:CR=1 FL=1
MKRFVVIGMGSIASRHRKNLKLLFPDAEIVGISSSGRSDVSSEENIDIVLKEVTELAGLDIEMAIVASPAPFHANHAIPLINMGIPTLIEKPVAMTSADCNRLIGAQEETGTPVVVGYCLRYLPAAPKIHDLINNGFIGELYNAHFEVGQYLPDWRPSKFYKDSVSAVPELGGGALLELSHEFDFALWVFNDLDVGYYVLRKSKELELKVEDMVDVIASSSNGALVSIHLDMLQLKAHRNYRFTGSKGSIEWDLLANKVIFTNRSSSRLIHYDEVWDSNCMYIDMLNDFLNLINGDDNRCVNLGSATRTLKFIDQVKQKANSFGLTL